MNLIPPSDPPADFDPAQGPTRTAQLLRFQGITRLDLPVDQVLDAARAAGLRLVVVLGLEADGSEYFASTVSDGADVVWLLERSKLKLLTATIDPNPV